MHNPNYLYLQIRPKTVNPHLSGCGTVRPGDSADLQIKVLRVPIFIHIGR